VISTLRARCKQHGVALMPPELASFALEVETEKLGIAAGLQDRLAQSHGGLTFMEFGPRPHYEPLPPRLLPPLLVAWRPDAAQESDEVHANGTESASCTFSTSAGTIVPVCDEDRHRQHVAAGLGGMGCETLPVQIEGY
jgi:hypothetical protein